MTKFTSNKRVVITGLGVISSLGLGWQDFWKNLLAGKSGISRIESFDTSKYDRHFAGEVKNFDPTQFLPKRKVSRMGRASQMAVAAAKLAVKDSKLASVDTKKHRIGICVGTTMGEPQVLEVMNFSRLMKGLESVDRKMVPEYPANMLVITVADELKLSGRTYLFANACAAGNYSIGYASDLIKSGQEEIMLAGGTDSMTKINLTGFSRLFAIAPEKCQPFDKDRKGIIVGEGAGMVMLESLESAKCRKARIYAEVLGYGLSCDAHHMTNPSVKGIQKAIEKSLKCSEISPDKIDYISAHGTGTPENDKAECAALKNIFNSRLKDISVSSIKSMLGHTMGAASALEAIACCLAIKDGVVPPTINYETPDPECDIDCVPNKARKHKVNVALNNSSAFGGNNCCLVLKRCF